MKAACMLIMAVGMAAVAEAAAIPIPVPGFVAQWGSLGSGPGQFQYPWGIAVGPDGSVYVVDHGNNRVQKFTNDGAFILQWGSLGYGDGQFDDLQDVALDASGNVYTIELGNARVQKFTSMGTFVMKWGRYGGCDGQFDHPFGIGTGADGYVYVADAANQRIQKFTDAGVFVTKWGSWEEPCWPGEWRGWTLTPTDVAVDPGGAVYSSDNTYKGLFKFSSAGIPFAQWGGPAGTGVGQFNDPFGVDVAADGTVYVADTGNNRVQILSTSGEWSVFGSFGTGEGQFNEPLRVAADGAGNVFVVDMRNHRVQKFSSGAATGTTKKSFGEIKTLYRPGR